MLNQGWDCGSPFPRGLPCSESAGEIFSSTYFSPQIFNIPEKGLSLTFITILFSSNGWMDVVHRSATYYTWFSSTFCSPQFLTFLRQAFFNFTQYCNAFGPFPQRKYGWM